MLVEKGGKYSRFMEICDLDKDNEICVEVGSDDSVTLIYLTIEEAKQVIEHLQKQISGKTDNSGFQGQNIGDGMSGFRG